MRSLLLFIPPLFALTTACAVEEPSAESHDSISSTTPRFERTPSGLTFTTPGLSARVGATCHDHCEDRDADGLTDAFEDALLDRLRPAVTFDEHEQLLDSNDHLTSVGRVFPAADGSIVATFVYLYERDYGAPNPLCFRAHKHAGDVERVALELVPIGAGSSTFRVRRAFTTGHEGSENDQSHVFAEAELDQLELVDSSDGLRWNVFVSQGKHAMYASKDRCEHAKLANILHQICASEDCAPDHVRDVAKFTLVVDIANVGEETARRVDDLTPLGFAGEHAFGSQRFCGGIDVSADDLPHCPPPVQEKFANPFPSR